MYLAIGAVRILIRTRVLGTTGVCIMKLLMFFIVEIAVEDVDEDSFNSSTL